MAPRTPKDPAKAPSTRKAAKPKAPPAAAAAPAEDSVASVAKPAKPAKSDAGKGDAGKGDAGKAKAPAFRLRDLVAQVASTTKAKKPDAKKSVEATLAAISAALGSGADLALPPLGKLRIARVSSNVMTLKLRTGAGEKSAGKPLADDAEDD